MVGLAEAEDVFFGSSGTDLTLTFEPSVLSQVERDLEAVDGSALGQLLPYVLDAHQPGTRRSVMRDPGEAPSRHLKQERGVYYTPSDVADHMTDWVLRPTASKSMLPVLDPACGTGVFLVSAAKHLLPHFEPMEVLGLLYGLDIDALSIDMACFALAGTLGGQSDTNLWRLWHLARLNLAVRDSISLATQWNALPPSRERQVDRESLRRNVAAGPNLPQTVEDGSPDWHESLRNLFPERDGNWNVVGNPPYAALGRRPDLKNMPHQLSSLRGANVTSSTNAFIPFMELAWLAASDLGRTCLVVPMSVAYNTSSPFVGLRKAICRAGGTWRFRFFDRTPDSVFGDDVKQRVAIVYRSPTTDLRLFTSGLTRWTSRQRREMFLQQRDGVELTDLNVASGIPKFENDWERGLYQAVRPGTRRGFAKEPSGSDQPEHIVEVGSTAYNAIIAYMGPDPDRGNARVNSVKHAFESPDHAAWAYAILTSNLTYWLWRVEGDGFHVSSSWVRRLPFHWTGGSDDRRLALVGSALWASALRHPVTATNASRLTVSFRPVLPRLMRDADEAILTTVAFDRGVAEQLATYRDDLISVGREGSFE